MTQQELELPKGWIETSVNDICESECTQEPLCQGFSVLNAKRCALWLDLAIGDLIPKDGWEAQRVKGNNRESMTQIGG